MTSLVEYGAKNTSVINVDYHGHVSMFHLANLISLRIVDIQTVAVENQWTQYDSDGCTEYPAETTI